MEQFRKDVVEIKFMLKSMQEKMDQMVLGWDPMVSGNGSTSSRLSSFPANQGINPYNKVNSSTDSTFFLTRMTNYNDKVFEEMNEHSRSHGLIDQPEMSVGNYAVLNGSLKSGDELIGYAVEDEIKEKVVELINVVDEKEEDGEIDSISITVASGKVIVRGDYVDDSLLKIVFYGDEENEVQTDDESKGCDKQLLQEVVSLSQFPLLTESTNCHSQDANGCDGGMAIGLKGQSPFRIGNRIENWLMQEQIVVNDLLKLQEDIKQLDLGMWKILGRITCVIWNWYYKLHDANNTALPPQWKTTWILTVPEQEHMWLQVQQQMAMLDLTYMITFEEFFHENKEDRMPTIDIDASDDEVDQVQHLNEASKGFIMAPVNHPAMKIDSLGREEPKVETIFGISGPMLNPARSPFIVYGDYSKDIVGNFAKAIQMFGIERVLVIYSEGLDEISRVRPGYFIAVTSTRIDKLHYDILDFSISCCMSSRLKEKRLRDAFIEKRNEVDSFNFEFEGLKSKPMDQVYKVVEKINFINWMMIFKIWNWFYKDIVDRMKIEHTKIRRNMEDEENPLNWAAEHELLETLKVLLEHHPCFVEKLISVTIYSHDKGKGMALIWKSSLYIDIKSLDQISGGLLMFLLPAHYLMIYILHADYTLTLLISMTTSPSTQLTSQHLHEDKEAQIIGHVSGGEEVLQTNFASSSILKCNYQLEICSMKEAIKEVSNGVVENSHLGFELVRDTTQLVVQLEMLSGFASSSSENMHVHPILQTEDYFGGLYVHFEEIDIVPDLVKLDQCHTNEVPIDAESISLKTGKSHTSTEKIVDPFENKGKCEGKEEKDSGHATRVYLQGNFFPWFQDKTVRAFQYFSTADDPNTIRMFEVLQRFLMGKEEYIHELSCYFMVVKEHDVLPNVTIYASSIDGNCKYGSLVESINIFEELVWERMVPDQVEFTSRIYTASLLRRYAGFSTCVRKGSGSHGKATLGIFRVHQFEKVEQFCIISQGGNDSWEIHEEMFRIYDDFHEELRIPYQVVSVVSGAWNDAVVKIYQIHEKILIIIWGWFYKDIGKRREPTRPGKWIVDWKIAWM